MSTEREFHKGKMVAADIASEVVSTAEAAEILGVTVGRVRHFLQEQRFGRKVGGRYLITRNEVREFAAEDRPKGRPEKK